MEPKSNYLSFKRNTISGTPAETNKPNGPGIYGKATRTGTPVKGILSGMYGQTAEEEINKKYEE